MYFIPALLLAQAILAAPILRRQLHGEGEACNSVFTDTDNGVGYGSEYAEQNLAKFVSGMKGRQLHGEGEACDSIFTQTDNGVGYGTENAENRIAQSIAGLTGNQVTGGGTSTGGSSSGSPPPAPPGGKGPKGGKRQLDKVANGFGEIGQAAGVQKSVDPVVTQLDSLDGSLTDGAASIGADFGEAEVTALESLGSSVPSKRQLDKTANGAAVLGKAMGAQKITGPLATSADTLDGTLTDGVANMGAGVADAEESMLEGVGNSVPVVF